MASPFNVPSALRLQICWVCVPSPTALSPSGPLCDIPSGCCFFTGPWTVTRSSLRLLHRVAVFCVLQPMFLVVSFPYERSPVFGKLGVALVVAGVVLRFLLPTPLHTRVVPCMPRRVSVCVRPNCSTPPRVVLVVPHLPPHAAMCVGTFMISAGVVRTSAGVVRSFVVDAGGVCTCAVAWVVCAAQWPHRCPWFAPPQFCRGFLPYPPQS